MEDVSHLLDAYGGPVGVLGVSSQAATNTVSANRASTAPGTVSESTSGEHAGDPAPGAITHDQRVSVERAHDRPRPMIRPGEWNDLT